MDAKERLSGQKVDFDCPHCGDNIEVSAQMIFENQETVTCPHCSSTIYLENSEALSKMEKQWKGLKKWMNS